MKRRTKARPVTKVVEEAVPQPTPAQRNPAQDHFGQLSAGSNLTIRDHFAACAMRSLIAPGFDPAAVAKTSYELADAMIGSR